MQHKKNIWFFYPSGPRLTGQELASRLILELLKDEVDLSFRLVKLAVFDRENWKSIKYLLRVFFSVIYTCFQMLMTSLNRNAIVYLCLGQSMKCLLLDGVPFGIANILNARRRSVVSLHGHFFMEWDPVSTRGMLFRWILNHSSKVTVLGLSQKKKLIVWGIAQEKIQIVNNTCEEFLEGLTKKEFPSTTINLLYLSNFIVSKGYREYLKMLLLLSEMNLPKRVEAVICGQFIKTSLDDSKVDLNSIVWINEIIAKINNSSSVRVCWMKGAYGHEKAKVFGKADIFVFPSYYRVEAQPIVLIEAMAAGCAIVASSVGEIPTMLVDGAGICLDDCSPKNLAYSICDLVNNTKKLQAKQSSARTRFESQYNRGIYADTWRHIFRELDENTKS